MSVTKIYFDNSLVIQKDCINNSYVLYLNNIKILFLTIGWYDNNYVLGCTRDPALAALASYTD